jgi:diguanylate cyclase (GGDEF)-like protein/putative nucleotidyltransferase with HDIG domain
MNPLKILIVEKERDAALLIQELEKAGCLSVCRRIDTLDEMSRLLAQERWDVIISEYRLPGYDSLDALQLIHDKGLDTPFIIVSGHSGEQAAVAAMKAGAGDYILKGNLKNMVSAIQREVRHTQVKRERLQSEAGLIAKDQEARRMHIRHLAMLNRMSQALSEAKDFDSLLKKALDGLMKALRFSAGALFLRDANNGEFSLASHQAISLEFAQSLNKITALYRQDAQKSGPLKHLLNHTLAISMRKLGLQSKNARYIITVPLKSVGKTIAIAMLPSRTKTIPTREEKQLLNTIGGQTGVAIENALLLQKMSQLSLTDELTRLYNRRHFYKVLEVEMSRARRYGRPLSLALLDIDSFKEINDKFGHINGDRVLKSLANTLIAYLRKTDVSFRYGGDEFAVILPETNAVKARDIIERIKVKWLHTPKTDVMLENPLGFSAGIIEYPRNAESQDSLLLLLDAALYCAKRSGGNRSTLVSEMGDISYATLTGLPSQVYALAATVDAKEAHGVGHSLRVARIAEMIGRKLSLSAEELADLRGASLLHDVGKIGIPDIILNKSDNLTPVEWEIVKKHSTEGAKIVSQIEKIANLAPLIRHHHEWYDGTGYPDGLKGPEIPLGSRIICVADAYDTMITPRSYKNMRSQNEALAELIRCAGTQFDPDIIKAVSSTSFFRSLDV